MLAMPGFYVLGSKTFQDGATNAGKFTQASQDEHDVDCNRLVDNAENNKKIFPLAFPNDVFLLLRSLMIKVDLTSLR
jgi:hypothetical protein